MGWKHLLAGALWGILSIAADAAGVVATTTLLVRANLVLLSRSDGWSYGASNIALAVVIWVLLRAGVEALFAHLSTQGAAA